MRAGTLGHGLSASTVSVPARSSSTIAIGTPRSHSVSMTRSFARDRGRSPGSLGSFVGISGVAPRFGDDEVDAAPKYDGGYGDLGQGDTAAASERDDHADDRPGSR